MKKAGRKSASRMLYTACALAICSVAGGVVRAQEPAAAPAPLPSPPKVMFERADRPPMSPDAIEFVGFQGGLSDKVVTGASFSATITTESTQTLVDGNQIQHTSTGSLARDSQGRTRRDMTMPAFGWANSGKPAPHVATVNDPVASARYVLDTDNKTARKMQVPANQWNSSRKQLEGPNARATEDSETVTTSLGTQMVGGISAEGTRTTRTIPAGQIGNAKPIVIVTERWYSPDLQMVVMTKRTDPRTGEASFQMTNIQRQEPAASLFQVPSDYTVTQRGPRLPQDRSRPGMAVPPPPTEQ